MLKYVPFLFTAAVFGMFCFGDVDRDVIADVVQFKAAIKRGLDSGVFTTAAGHSGSLKLAKKPSAGEKKPAVSTLLGCLANFLVEETSCSQEGRCSKETSSTKEDCRSQETGSPKEGEGS